MACRMSSLRARAAPAVRVCTGRISTSRGSCGLYRGNTLIRRQQWRCAQRPRVLLSTSLLARGLDFDPSVSHCSCWSPRGIRRTFCIVRGARLAWAGVGGRLFLGGVGGLERGKSARCARLQRIFALKTRR
ncbi:hypothetical protein V8E53_007530 [Lactarius tabidus]